jgi:hypothetical protein
MTIVLAVIAGYLLAYLPRVVAFAVKNNKPKASAKREETTEAELRKAQRTIKEYMNFMTYDGSAQDDIIID